MPSWQWGHYFPDPFLKAWCKTLLRRVGTTLRQQLDCGCSWMSQEGSSPGLLMVCEPQPLWNRVTSERRRQREYQTQNSNHSVWRLPPESNDRNLWHNPRGIKIRVHTGSDGEDENSCTRENSSSTGSQALLHTWTTECSLHKTDVFGD